MNYIREELARTDTLKSSYRSLQCSYGYAYSLQKEYCLREVNTDCYGHTATTTVTTATTTATSGYCYFIPVSYVSEYWYHSIKLRYFTFPSLLCTKIQHLHLKSGNMINAKPACSSLLLMDLVSLCPYAFFVGHSEQTGNSHKSQRTNK